MFLLTLSVVDWLCGIDIRQADGPMDPDIDLVDFTTM